MSKIKKKDKLSGTSNGGTKKGDKKIQRDSVSSAAATPTSSEGKAKTRTFQKYDLGSLPEAALPFEDTAYKGKHSYTVCVKDAAPWSDPFQL